MSKKEALNGNQNAAKEGTGFQVNFYLSGVDAATIMRLLARQLNREPTKQEMQKYAREQAKNGIWNAIKGELPAIII